MTRYLENLGSPEEQDAATLSDLIACQDWKGVADSLEAGDTIPVRVMSQTEGEFVLARLAWWLRMELVEGHWYVEQDVEGKVFQ